MNLAPRYHGDMVIETDDHFNAQTTTCNQHDVDTVWCCVIHMIHEDHSYDLDVTVSLRTIVVTQQYPSHRSNFDIVCSSDQSVSSHQSFISKMNLKHKQANKQTNNRPSSTNKPAISSCNVPSG